MEVRRPTTLECLAVKLSGTQHLDMREGEGPSSSMYSVRRRCADVGQTIFDTTSSSGVGGVSAALSIEAARVRQRGSAMCCASPPSPDADGSYAEVESTECQHLTLTSFSSTAGVELAVGEYRFSFELPLPAKLLPSVESPLGRVAYQVEAVARRPGRVFHSSVSSKPVAVTVHHVPRLAAGRQNAMLLGFPSFQMLAATPLVFETSSGSGRWKLSVYSRSSRALFLGTPLKLQLYATRKGEDCEDETSLELVEFGMRLMERITHRP
ncbi:hypothetical protein GGF46_004141 [Coemansia sp. RSA 552]|nr:hypothetical protein GGF46_004141 [Coemansia sp. RSA 552]